MTLWILQVIDNDFVIVIVITIDWDYVLMDYCCYLMACILYLVVQSFGCHQINISEIKNCFPTFSQIDHGVNFQDIKNIGPNKREQDMIYVIMLQCPNEWNIQVQLDDWLIISGNMDLWHKVQLDYAVDYTWLNIKLIMLYVIYNLNGSDTIIQNYTRNIRNTNRYRKK